MPKLKTVKDEKPKQRIRVIRKNIVTEQLYEVQIAAGQYVGIPGLTYPEAQTVISSYSP